MAAADGVARHHGHDGLGQPSDLDLEVEHVEPAHAVGTDVAVVASHPLVATRAEGLGPLTGEDGTAHVGIVPDPFDGVGSSKRVVGRKALRTSGRQMVSLAMPSDRS